MTKEEIVKRQNRIQSLSELLNKQRSEIAKILPRGMSVDRVIKTAIIAAMDNPKIGEKCTPMSIYRSVLQATLMGLSVGTGFCEGYLIPYKGTCTFRASYLGWIKVALRSDGIDLIRASVVHQNDEFLMREQPPSVRHSPRWAQGIRGGLIGAVAVAYTIESGAHLLRDFSFVDKDELTKARELSSDSADVWRNWPYEMAKKVAIRRLCKMLPSNEAMDRLASIENSADNGRPNTPDPEIDSVEDMVADASSVERNNQEEPTKKKSRTSSLKNKVLSKADEEPPPTDEEPPDYGEPK